MMSILKGGMAAYRSKPLGARQFTSHGLRSQQGCTATARRVYIEAIRREPGFVCVCILLVL